MVVSAKMLSLLRLFAVCPTLVIGSHPKFKGIMRTLDLEEWVCENFSAETMITNSLKLWNQRNQVKITLNSKIKNVKELARLNARLTSELVD